MVNTTSNLYKQTIKLSQNHSYIATCYHEAGHAVCGLLTFMKITDVSVFKKRRISGETNYELITDEQAQEYPDLINYLIKTDIYINYAGLMAEKIYYHDMTGSNIVPNVLKDGIEHDVKEVAKIVKTNNLAPAGRKRYLYKKKMMKEVGLLLEQNWDDVKIVAHALFENKSLTYEELKKVLRRKSANKKFWKKQFIHIHNFVTQNKRLDKKDLKIILPV